MPELGCPLGRSAALTPPTSAAVVVERQAASRSGFGEEAWPSGDERGPQHSHGVRPPSDSSQAEPRPKDSREAAFPINWLPTTLAAAVEGEGHDG